MKTQFLNNLKNGRISAQQNQAELQQLADTDFVPIEEHIKAELKSKVYWVSDYFYAKLNVLNYHFSKELCEHIIDVKHKLQNTGEKGFDIMNSSQSTVPLSQSSQQQTMSVDLSNYQVKDVLNTHLQQKNVPAVRAFLMSELNNQRVGIEYLIQTVFFVENKLSEVFEEYKTSAFIADINQDQSAWNAYYFDKQQNDLNQNFAIKRFIHLINVREMLMKKGDSQFQQIEASPIKPEQTALPKVDSQQKESSNQNTTHTTSSDQDKGSNWRVWAAIIVAGGVALITLYKLLK